MYASDYRALALKNLRGHWGKPIVVSLIVSTVGGGTVGGFNGGFGGGLGSSLARLSMEASRNPDAVSSASSVAEQLEEALSSIPAAVWGVGIGVLFALLLFAAVLSLVITAVSSVLTVGNADFYTRFVGGGNPSIGRLFKHFKHFFRIFGMYMLMNLFISLWSLLLIVPGIIASFAYSMAPYLMAEDPTLGPLEAIRKSKEMMQGYKGKLFCLRFSYIGWVLLTMLTCGIGSIWLNPYVEAGIAAFYLDRTGRVLPDTQV